MEMMYKIKVTQAHCLARDLFLGLKTKVKVHISEWTARG